MHAYFLQFVSGLSNTCLVAAASGLLGTVLGLLVAAAKLSNSPLLKGTSGVYTTVIRGVPELLIVLIIYFGGTAAITALTGRYVEVNAQVAGVASLTTVFAAYAAEVFRGAIKSIPKGQVEAAMSLGLALWQIWMLIIIPQMIPLALPAYRNLTISLVKETSLISIVGLTDIMRVAYIGSGAMRAPLAFYLVASIIYLILTSLLLVAFQAAERSYRNGWRAQ